MDMLDLFVFVSMFIHHKAQESLKIDAYSIVLYEKAVYKVMQETLDLKRLRLYW